MKRLLIISLSCAVIFLFIVETSFSERLKCYTCNSYMQQDCADWFDNRTQHMQECADDETMCRKIIQEVFFDNHWETRYIRQCAKSGTVGGREGRECTDRVGTFNVKVRYCHCDNQDGCNGAENNKSSSVNIVIGMVVLFVSHYFLKLL